MGEIQYGQTAADIFDHMSEDRMLAIEPRCCNMRDEELASIRSRACIGHRKDTGAIMPEIRAEFIGESVSRAAGSITLRASALDHEIIDYPVELQSIIERNTGFIHIQDTFCETDEIAYCHRTALIFKLHEDITFISADNGIDTVLEIICIHHSSIIP